MGNARNLLFSYCKRNAVTTWSSHGHACEEKVQNVHELSTQSEINFDPGRSPPGPHRSIAACEGVVTSKTVPIMRSIKTSTQYYDGDGGLHICHVFHATAEGRGSKKSKLILDWVGGSYSCLQVLHTRQSTYSQRTVNVTVNVKNP